MEVEAEVEATSMTTAEAPRDLEEEATTTMEMTPDQETLIKVGEIRTATLFPKAGELNQNKISSRVLLISRFQNQLDQEDGETHLQKEMMFNSNLAGEAMISEEVETGETTMVGDLQQEVTFQEMTEEVEAGAEATFQDHLEVEVDLEPASNVIKKATWLENVQLAETIETEMEAEEEEDKEEDLEG